MTQLNCYNLKMPHYQYSQDFEAMSNYQLAQNNKKRQRNRYMSQKPEYQDYQSILNTTKKHHLLFLSMIGAASRFLTGTNTY